MKNSTHTTAQNSHTPSDPGATSDETGFAHGRQVPRRAALAGLGLGSLSALVAPAMLGGSPAFAATRKSGHKHTPVQDTNGTIVQPGPFTVQATSLLSEDWFQTDDVLVDIDGGDRIVPFTTQAGDVEALVLTVNQDGTRSLAHFYRDNTLESGWGYTTVDTGFTTVSNVSVASVAGQAPVALVSGDATLSIEHRSILKLQGGTWNASPVTAGMTGVNRAGIAHDGSWYFYVTSMISNTAAVMLYTAAAPNGATVLHLTDSNFQDIGMVYDPAGMYGRIVMYSETSTGVGRIDMFPQTNPTTFSTKFQNITTKASALLGAYGAGTDPQIDVLWQDTSGNVTATEILDSGVSTLELGLSAGALGTGAVATWKQGEAYTFVVVNNETVQLIAQKPDAGSWQFLSPVPLVAGIGQVYSVATDPSQSTLFAIDVDASLSVLTLGSTGWTQTLAHRPAATLQEVTCWNTTISVFDTNGIGVSNGQMQISTDRPVAFWQPTGSTMLAPGTAVTMTADVTGMVSISIPVEELDAAVLTVQPLDSTGKPSGSPFTVNPDTDVQKFLSGTGSLQAIGTLTGTALLNATNTSWDVVSHSSTGSDPLLPSLKAVPAGQQQQVANDLAAAMNHIATLPTLKQADNGVTSAFMDLTATAPAFITSNDPHHFDSQTDVDTSWWAEVEHEAESVFHGLRHGATSLQRLVTQWDSDAEQWTLNLVVTIGDKVEHLIQFVVTEVEHAIHAISAFIHALGADLKDFWNWLKHHVMALLKDADANAKIIETWFTPFLTQLTSVFNTIEIDADTFFDNLEDKINAQIDALAKALEEKEFGSSAPLPPPTNDTGSDNDLLFKDAGDVVKFFTHGPASWLMDKMQKYLPADPSNGGPDFPSPDQILTDLIADVVNAVPVIKDLGTAAWDGIEPFLKDAGTFTQTSMSDFLTALKGCVSDATTLIEDLLKTLFDAMDYAIGCVGALLSYEFPVVPFMSDLLEMAGIDVTVSIQRIVSLVAAFPATLMFQIMGGSGLLFPSDNTPPAPGSKRPAVASAAGQDVQDSAPVDRWAVGLGISSAMVQALWSFNDIVLDQAAVLGVSEQKDAFKGNALSTALDIICPVLITMLQWPAPASDDKLTQPFWKGTVQDGSGVGDKVPWMLFTSFIPPAAGVVALADGTNKDPDNPDSPDTFYSDYGVPVICSLSGIANTILGGFYGHDEDVSGFDIAAGVLANLSYVVAPLGFPCINNAEDYNTPALAKCIIDAVGNFGTCMTMSAQAHAGWIGPVAKRVPL